MTKPSRFLVPVLLMALLLVCGCSAPANNPATSSPTSAAATSAAAASTSTSASASEAPTEAPKESTAPSAQSQPTSDAFAYYNKVKLGMTKAEVDGILGLQATATTGEYDPKNSYNYDDGNGYGVYVLYNGDLKAYSKTVLYPSTSEALAPLTKKPVTEEQADAIADGSSYDDVVKALGGDGLECSQTSLENDPSTTPTKIYRWGNTDDTVVQVVISPEGKVHGALFLHN